MQLLDEAAARAPERAFLVERDARDVWHEVSYATMAARSWRVGAALRALGASEDRPVMILSGNGIEHAMVTFGALRAGIPVVPVDGSVAAGAGDGFARLRAIGDAVRAGVIFAREGTAYAAAARAAGAWTGERSSSGEQAGPVYVCVGEPAPGVRAFDYARLLTHAPPARDAVTVRGETVAKVLFATRDAGETSGVVTTHAMICAMLQAIAQRWPFLAEHPPVVVDALPWSDWLGGNAVLGIVLRHAGTLYVADGRSAPDDGERTPRLRTEIAPTLAFDVPHGWAAWLQRLRGDDVLRRRWLSRLDRACWSGAALAPATRDGLRAIGVPLAAAWGSAATTGPVTLTERIDPAPDVIGVPLPGVELKLVPNGDAYEARVRGPQVTNGYWWRPDRTAAAFDDEGFFRTGDLVRPLAARAPQRGLAFVGRLDAWFKLGSGAWVDAAAVRARFLAECGDAADVLVTGEGGDAVGLLVWPSEDALLLDRDLLRAQIAAAMRRVGNGERSPARPRRAIVVEEPLAVANRTALLARLHASEPDAEVIVV